MVIKSLNKIFLVLLITLFLSATVKAESLKINSVIHSELRQVLNLSQQTDLVQIIVDFSDRINLNDPNIHGRHNHTNLINEAHRKADLSQKELIQFLNNNNITSYEKLWIINSLAVTVEASMVPKIAALVGISRIRYNKKITLNATTTSEPGTAEWNINAVKAPAVWSAGFTGQNTVIGIIGTGVDVYHPDLAPRYRGGSNSWFDATKADQNTASPVPIDVSSSGHGTAVISVALGGNSSGDNIGVAPDARWIAANIFTKLPGSNKLDFNPVDIIKAFQWMLDPDKNSNTNDAPDVVNNSWNFQSVDVCVDDYQILIDTLKASGIAVVFSAGNAGGLPGTSLSPANNANVISVGAVGQGFNIANFSSRGPAPAANTVIDACAQPGLINEVYPNLVAPGIGIKTADKTNGGLFPNSYSFQNGTSFSAPHIAGAIAILKSAFPIRKAVNGSVIDDIIKAIRDNATDLGIIGSKDDFDYGWGFLDIDGAYQQLLSSGNYDTTQPFVKNHIITILKDTIDEPISILQNARADDRYQATNVLDNNTIAITTMPTNGSLTLDKTTAIVTYTANAGFLGKDSFTFIVSDSIPAPNTNVSNTGVVNIDIVNEIVPPTPAPQVSASSGGGGCSISASAEFDPILLLLLVLSLMYFYRRKI